MDEAAQRGGKASVVDKAAGMVELPPLWTWTMGCGEGLPSWTRPWGGRGAATVVEATGRGGEAATVVEATGTSELPPLWTWSWDGWERLPPWTRPWGEQGGSPL